MVGACSACTTGGGGSGGGSAGTEPIGPPDGGGRAGVGPIEDEDAEDKVGEVDDGGCGCGVPLGPIHGDKMRQWLAIDMFDLTIK